MVPGIPIGKRADESVIAEGEKVPVGIVVVNWQVKQAMYQHTDANNLGDLPMVLVGDRQAN